MWPVLFCPAQWCMAWTGVRRQPPSCTAVAWWRVLCLVALHGLPVLSAACDLSPFTGLSSWRANNLFVHKRCAVPRKEYFFEVFVFTTRAVSGSCTSSTHRGLRLCNFTLHSEPLVTDTYAQWLLDFNSSTGVMQPSCFNGIREQDRAFEFTSRTLQYQVLHSVIVAVRRQAPRIPVLAFQMVSPHELHYRCHGNRTNPAERGLNGAHTILRGYGNVTLREGRSQIVRFFLDLSPSEGCNLTGDMVRVYRDDYLLSAVADGVRVDMHPVLGDYRYEIQIDFHMPILSLTAGQYVLALYIAEQHSWGTHQWPIEQTLLHEFTVQVLAQDHPAYQQTSSTTAATPITPAVTTTELITSPLPVSTIQDTAGHSIPTRGATPSRVATWRPSTPSSAGSSVLSVNTVLPSSPVSVQRSQSTDKADSIVHYTHSGPRRNSTPPHEDTSATTSEIELQTQANRTQLERSHIYTIAGSGLLLLIIIFIVLGCYLRHSWCRSRTLFAGKMRCRGKTFVKRPDGLPLPPQQSATMLLNQPPSTTSDGPLYAECQGHSMPMYQALGGGGSANLYRNSDNFYTIDPSDLSRANSTLNVSTAYQANTVAILAVDLGKPQEPQYACPVKMAADTRMPMDRTTCAGEAYVNQRRGTIVAGQCLPVQRRGIPPAAEHPTEEYMHMSMKTEHLSTI
eukprot:scpid59947/ scgid3091/ 